MRRKSRQSKGSIKVLPYCGECGREIEKLLPACRVTDGNSNYRCEDCRRRQEEKDQEEAQGSQDHYIGLTDLERVRVSAIVDIAVQ